MTDLVTGASGFIGSHLTRALAAKGDRVRVLQRRKSRPDRLAGAPVEFSFGDLSDRSSLAAAIAGVDRVFHCAALVADWGRPRDFYETNVLGVANLLSVCREAGVKRFIHLSTTDVYGFPDRSVDETAPYRYRGWPYGDTKIDGEKMVWSEARGSGLPVTVIRPANVYGVGSESFVGEIADLIRTRSMVRVGRSPAPAGLCHVDNVVRCLIRAADSDDAVGEAFNVTDGNGMSWAEFANQLADALGEPRPSITLPKQAAYALGWMFEQLRKSSNSSGRPLLTRMAVEILGTDQSFDIAKARRHLDYAPVGTASDHMARLAHWLREERS